MYPLSVTTVGESVAQDTRFVDHCTAAVTPFGCRLLEAVLGNLWPGFATMDTQAAAGDRTNRAAAHSQLQRNLPMRQLPFVKYSLDSRP